MDNLARLKLRTNEPDEAILRDCLESAKAAIMARRYPFQEWPYELERRYLDLQFRCAMDRGYESSWISESLLQEVTPLAGRVT